MCADRLTRASAGDTCTGCSMLVLFFATRGPLGRVRAHIGISSFKSRRAAYRLPNIAAWDTCTRIGHAGTSFWTFIHIGLFRAVIGETPSVYECAPVAGCLAHGLGIGIVRGATGLPRSSTRICYASRIGSTRAMTHLSWSFAATLDAGRFRQNK